MSKFLLKGSLKTDLSNLTFQGVNTIKTLSTSEIIENGKLKTTLLPPLAITSISAVLDNVERDNLTAEEGDFVKVTSTGKFYAFDGTAWLEINNASTIDELSNCNITNPVNRDILQFNGTNWINNSSVRSHIDDSSIHYSQTDIDHNNILNIGTNSHATIDSHISAQIAKNSGYDIHVADNTVHFTENTINHNNILNSGTNTHAQIDTAITDSTNHINDFTRHITLVNKGQLITHNGVAVTNLASSGINGDVLTIDTAENSGLKWVAPAGGGPSYDQSLNTTDNVQFNTVNVNGSTLSNVSGRLNSSTAAVFGSGETGVDVLDFKLAKDGGNSDIKILQRFKEGTNPWHVNGIGIKQFQQFCFYIFDSSNFSLRTTKSSDIGDSSTNGSDRIQFSVDASGRMSVRRSITIGHDNTGLQTDSNYSLKLTTLGGLSPAFSGIYNDASNQHSSTSANWTVISSQKLKRDIASHIIDNQCLDDIMSVRIVDFKYMHSENMRMGVIAEELQINPVFNCCIKTLPLVEMKDCRDSYKLNQYADVPVLDQEKLFWSLFAAMQRLITENNTKTATIATLETRLTAIESLLGL